LVHPGVYKWIDGSGTIHFTDEYSNMPEKYCPVAQPQRSPKDTSPPSLEKKTTPALAPKVSAPPGTENTSKASAFYSWRIRKGDKIVNTKYAGYHLMR